MRDRENDTLQRGGVEFRYASAALLIACARADLNETQEEKNAVRELMIKTFRIPERTIQKLFDFAYDAAGQDEYLSAITALIDDHFPIEDKKLVLKQLWEVAYADNEIGEGEATFILKVAAAVGLTPEEVEEARQAVAG